MKKFVLGLVSGVILTASTVAYASDAIQAYLFPVRLEMNGRTLEGDAESPILNYNGLAYAPVRSLVESMGGTVGFERETNTIAVRYPDLAHVRENAELDLTKPEAIRLFGDKYAEIAYPGDYSGLLPEAVELWRYDFGVRGGYRVQNVRQYTETWADVDGLRSGGVRLQLLFGWKEERVAGYTIAYATESGEIRYEVGEEQLKQVADRLMAAKDELEHKHDIRLIFVGAFGQQVELDFRRPADYEKPWSPSELAALRRTVHETAGLSVVQPFPLRLVPFFLKPQPDMAGVITGIDEQKERILIVDQTTLLGEAGMPEAVWVQLNEEGKIVNADGEELAFDDLEVGRQVKAWYDYGIFNDSYPGQTKALKIVAM